MNSNRFSPSLIARAAVLGGVLLSAACTDDATAPQPARLPSGISAVDNPDLARNLSITPVIDGAISKGEYSGAASFTFMAQIPSTGTNVILTPVTVYVEHDQTNLYLAATFDRKSAFHPLDVVSFEFDNDNDGIREDGDDIVFTRPSLPPNTQSYVFDFYRYNGGAANIWDTTNGGTSDGASAWGVIGTKGVFEIRHPLNSTDDAHDVSINPWIFPQTVGLQTGVQLELGAVGSGVYSKNYKPSFTSYCGLMISKTGTSVNCP
jgi:hypothetical protein